MPRAAKDPRLALAGDARDRDGAAHKRPAAPSLGSPAQQQIHTLVKTLAAAARKSCAKCLQAAHLPHRTTWARRRLGGEANEGPSPAKATRGVSTRPVPAVGLRSVIACARDEDRVEFRRSAGAQTRSAALGVSVTPRTRRKNRHQKTMLKKGATTKRITAASLAVDPAYFQLSDA